MNKVTLVSGCKTMATELINDKHSIKTLLFSKAIPSYRIPVPTQGYKIYSCIDCGDRYIIKSSYDYHINRQSVKITYKCRHCGQTKIFYNRCNLLSHIRAHAFKSATINVSDLQIEPLPLAFFPNLLSIDSLPTHQEKPGYSPIKICFECNADNSYNPRIAYKDRAEHYMQYTNEIHSCPICLFTLPTTCALKTHLRLHLKKPPYYCPECGKCLPIKSIAYPYNHDCDGFNMMRATTRQNCTIEESHIFHPNEYIDHMKNFHLIKVYKCPVCITVCFNEETIQKHLSSHKTDLTSIVFFQCGKCFQIVLPNQIEKHLTSHVKSFVYPCWTCGKIFKLTSALIYHHIDKHSQALNLNIEQFIHILNEQKMQKSIKGIYNVLKQCDKCKQSFTYKCKYDDIKILPNECPNCKCLNNSVTTKIQIKKKYSSIVCHLCKKRISQNWEDIKVHYTKHHKSHKCLDIKVVISRLQQKPYKSKKKINFKHVKSVKKNETFSLHTNRVKVSLSKDKKSIFECLICGDQYDTKKSFETHIIVHRDPCMAYQCMECGQCFVVKPSFSTHLYLEHGISNVVEYINQKQCYNEDALIKHQKKSNEPLKENQCEICRQEFNHSSSLENHFKVHGMAFLKKNRNKTNNP